MKLRFEFNDWEELDCFVKAYVNHGTRLLIKSEDPKETVDASELLKKAKKAADPAPEPEPAKEEKPKKAKKAAEPAPEPDEDGFKPATPEDEVPREFIEDSKVDEASAKLLLADLIKSGKREEVKELLASYEVSKLTEFMRKCPEKLPELFEKARAL